MGFVYDYPTGNCWEHTIEVLSLQDLPRPLKDYVPTCTSAKYASSREDMEDLQSLKALAASRLLSCG
ncbi:plasmid pRiA4b ORF-3 family protein [Bacteroides cellulosilyticus]|uniref:plasmid pRiA4b ORF-3 family protein n=1 Tax=Bacteroides cellulosilyticus TaxID=246787 RepID=UPI0012302F44|nr:plasmid pRiA4b ORF-3 family protein [Bacteroides cellulosilyticus]KAA5431208.1 plasmid pRiA4b ORF-3 family protein [Bacteroides cellulosilyticus]KAA5436648.1 plasmid pRiA4b ORF-3 family protein [Bacteroides cellulosilyticus]KAA5456915.1 plasmid pRiA4b ORF-3 family protein [Bacteroides cellulosilyticus]